jgi:hypothetical protein
MSFRVVLSGMWGFEGGCSATLCRYRCDGCKPQYQLQVGCVRCSVCRAYDKSPKMAFHSLNWLHNLTLNASKCFCIKYGLPLR